MSIRKATAVQPSEITPQALFLERRRFIRLAAGLSAAALLPKQALAGGKLPGIKTGNYTVPDQPTPFEDITHYNNFYEFGTDFAEILLSPVSYTHLTLPTNREV